MPDFEYRLTGDLAAKARMEGFPARHIPLLIRNLNTVSTQLQRYIVSGKLSGQVLKSHTGNLKRGILQLPAIAEGGVVTSGIGLAKETWYGLAHEFGADIPERTPKNAKALHWIGADGASVFAMRARAFRLPERSFLRAPFAEFQERYVEAARSATQEAL